VQPHLLTRCKRFTGFIFFLGATALVGLAAAEQPYRFGAEDTLNVQVLDLAEIPDRPVKIDKNGFIDLPLVGRLQAAGKTATELEADMAAKLSHYVRNPRISVHVAEYHSQPVSVLGEVGTPGVYQLSGPKHLLEMLSMAGGLRPDAGTTVRITREGASGMLDLPGSKPDSSGKYVSAEVDLDALLSGKTPAANILMQPNDVVSVPKADMVYVIGDVKKAGGFTLRAREQMTVLQALSLAEGMERTAAGQKAKLLRKSTAGADRTEISLDVSKILANRAPDVPMKPDDILVIPNNAARSVALRSLETAVNIGTGVAVFRR
jgi:polysaccharide export outer membrane protein